MHQLIQYVTIMSLGCGVLIVQEAIKVIEHCNTTKIQCLDINHCLVATIPYHSHEKGLARYNTSRS